MHRYTLFCFLILFSLFCYATSGGQRNVSDRVEKKMAETKIGQKRRTEMDG